MSRLTRMMAASQAVSLAAMEEASRRGRRTADIDDMLLALSIDSGVAGQVLRSIGITIDRARAAVSLQHAQQLSHVGISAASDDGRITFHETAAAFEWSKRALELLTRSTQKGKNGDAAAMLRELLDEPSGLIAEILAHLGTSTDAVRSRLDDAERIPSHNANAIDPARRRAASDAFVSAPPSEAWALLSDPRRVPEWDPGIASITVPEYNGAATGMAWEARSVTERRHDGKPIRMKPEAVRQQVELTHLEPDHAIAWRFTYPDAPHSNARHVRIDLAPAAGGTQLRLTLQRERRPGTKRRRIRGFILRPAHRFIVWLQLTQLTAEISRVYR